MSQWITPKISGVVCLHWQKYPPLEDGHFCPSLTTWAHPGASRLFSLGHCVWNGMWHSGWAAEMPCNHIVVVRCLDKLSVCCSNTVVPGDYLLLRLKLVRLQPYERKEFCFWHFFCHRTLEIVHDGLYRSQNILVTIVLDTIFSSFNSRMQPPAQGALLSKKGLLNN